MKIGGYIFCWMLLVVGCLWVDGGAAELYLILPKFLISGMVLPTRPHKKDQQSTNNNNVGITFVTITHISIDKRLKSPPRKHYFH